MPWLQTALVAFVAASGNPGPVELDAWQYRFGDSPSTADGRLTWLEDDWGAPGWQPVTLPGYPSRLAEGDAAAIGGYLWLRARLPAGAWRDPVLKLSSVLGHFEAYIDGALVWRYPPEGLGARGAHGNPLQLVPLPAGPGGGVVALRILTTYGFAGVRGTPQVGERADFVEAILREGATRWWVGWLMLVAGAFALVVLRGRGLRLSVPFALFSSGAGLYTLNYVELRQLALPLPPALWTVLWAFSLSAMSVGLLRLANELLRGASRWLSRLARAHAALGVGFVAFSLVSWALLELVAGPVTRPILVGFFALLTVVRGLMVVGAVALMTVLVRFAVRAGPLRARARLFAVGYALLWVAGLRELAVAFGLPVPTGTWVHWGLLSLVGALALLLQRAWVDTEQRVAEQEAQLAQRAREKETMLRDLHDGIGGITTNIRLLADLARQDGGRARELLDAIGELSVEGLAELRTLTRTLDEEAPLTWAGLVAELRRAGGQVLEPQDVGFTVDAALPPDDADREAPAALGLTVARVFREALTNVVKHSGARRVVVTARLSADAFELVVEDDGPGGRGGGGLDTGRGLVNMQARARELGGHLEVTRDGGTRLSLTLPRKPPAAGEPASQARALASEE